MSRNYPADTQIQNFLTESYIKEQNARLGWYHQRQQNPNKGSKQVRLLDFIQCHSDTTSDSSDSRGYCVCRPPAG